MSEFLIKPKEKKPKPSEKKVFVETQQEIYKGVFDHITPERAQFLIDEFQQLKRYFRDWNESDPSKSFTRRPAMKKAIENFEKHLEALK